MLKTDDSDILILADGMGSGVKANILATLTSKILGTMLYEGAALESCVETIAKTLPICQVRKVAYATFSVLQIFHSGEAYLVEFDNPSCVFIRDGKIVNYDKLINILLCSLYIHPNSNREIIHCLTFTNSSFLPGYKSVNISSI